MGKLAITYDKGKQVVTHASGRVDRYGPVALRRMKDSIMAQGQALVDLADGFERSATSAEASAIIGP